jgi:energy-converting hydrogenase Eha subunit E
VAVNCCVALTAMLALGGATAIEVSVTPAGTVIDAFPLIPPSEAVTVVEPAAMPAARPLEFTVATVGVATVQLAVELTLEVEPLLYVAVAVNCCVAPTGMLALGGATAIEVSVTPAGTVTDAFPLMPFSKAVTVVEPATTPAARPLEFTVATAGVATVQLAVELTLAVEPSL